MSYGNKYEYMIVPTDTFKIIRGCAGCGSKQIFTCKGRFRVNSNGNLLDVWLIYGCEKCEHTYNLPIYERLRADKIPKAEYQRFLENDKDAVFRYGTDKSVFAANRAETDRNLIEYKVVPMTEKEAQIENLPITIELHNYCDIPVRADKIAAGILKISRSRVTELIKNGNLSVSIINNKK